MFHRCVTGNIFEFALKPVWHHSRTIFGCHIEPIPDYTIYDLEVRVEFHGKLVNDGKLHFKKTFKGDHPAKAKEL